MEPSPGFSQTRSTTPAAATEPKRSAAPSSAGPLAVEQLKSRPSTDNKSSVLVPMSSASRTPGLRSIRVASATASRSEPTKPPTNGGMWT